MNRHNRRTLKSKSFLKKQIKRKRQINNVCQKLVKSVGVPGFFMILRTFNMSVLADIMIAWLPNKIFRSKTTTFYDPAFACGDLLAAVYRRLRANGHNHENIQKRIFGNECSEIYRKLALQRYPYLEGVDLTVSEYFSDHRNMKFDVIVGNPPYNGIKVDIVHNARVYEPFIMSGFCSYYPFIAIERELLKPGGFMVYITPNKWLSNNQGNSLRNELFKDGKLAYLDVRSQPQEWNGKVQTGQVAVFVFEKDRQTHALSVFSTLDGRFPNIPTLEAWDLLRKVCAAHPELPRVEFYFGADIDKPSKNIIPKEEICVVRGGVIKTATVFMKDVDLPHRQDRKRTSIAKDLNQKFLLYPDFDRSPFKNRIGIIDPMPVHNTIIVVATPTPKKHAALVESPLAKFIWRCFYNTKHFARSLTNLLPDVTSLLPDNPTENDINEIFGLTVEQVQYVNELLVSYGKGM